ncbi:MAG: hypothetical protein NVS3B3_13870 [Aquirhabdus sp.]
MHVATGIQNKVLEYFAMGLPSVVTPSVAQGLLPEAAGVCCIAADPTDWAQELMAIASHSESTEKMTLQARHYVEVHHSWERIGDAYCDRLESLMQLAARKATSHVSTATDRTASSSAKSPETT